MGSIISTILIATFSSFLTFQLSTAKFRSEKWWELKVASYQKILEALHESKLFSSYYLDAHQEGGQVSEEQAKELSAKGKKAHDEIVKMIDVGTFLLSDKAMERLYQYMNESSEAEDVAEFFTHLDKDYQATKSCIDDLILIAKDDLDKTHGGIDFKSYYLNFTKKIQSLIQKIKGN